MAEPTAARPMPGLPPPRPIPIRERASILFVEKGIERLEAALVVGDTQRRAAGMDGNVEIVLADIDSGTDHAKIGHLRRPCLGYEPKVPATTRA